MICGIGAVSALGPDVRSLERALREGRDGLRPVTRFDTAPFAPVHLGGCVTEGDSCVQWAVQAALEAWDDAGLEVPPRRVAVVAGTTEGDEAGHVIIARAVAEAIGARGPQLTISTACTSSANAIGLGKDLLDRGDADVVVAGGAERLMQALYAGFYRLGVLAVEPCAPFGETRGTTLGEGAGFVVLARQSARSWAHLLGYGLASDAWHETTPEPRGGGIARATRAAIEDAGVAPDAIDYVNAHGTGTAANDDSEWRGVQAALGERASAIPISGSKSFLGHAQGAAGVLELITTLLCLREGDVPPTLRVGAGRPGGPPDPVAEPTPAPRAVSRWLSNSAAFGGANAVLCLGGEPDARPEHSRVVRVAGLGVAEVERDVARDAALFEELAAQDTRGTDPSARFALAASLRALADGGLRVRGALRERAGLFAGARRASPESVEEYGASIERSGIARCSAAAFARLVLHAPTGTVCQRLSLRGPTTTLCAERTAGLLAVAYAVRQLRFRRDADLLLALGFDERDVGEDAELTPEGAACVALRADEGDGPVVRGVGLTGPGRWEDAIERALADAGLSHRDVSSWHLEQMDPSAPALGSARLAVDAAAAARDGAIAVAAHADDGAGCALVFGGET